MILNEISGAHLNGSPVSELWLGGVKLYPSAPPPWSWSDSFNRSAIGSDWAGSSGEISSGVLRAVEGAGTVAQYWSSLVAPSDNFAVEVKLGPVDEVANQSEIRIGSAAEHIGFRFNNSLAQLIRYSGVSTGVLASGAATTWPAGTVLRLARVGNSITLHRNGTLHASATSDAAQGATNRRAGLVTRCTRTGSAFPWNPYVYRRGPTFDDVTISTTA